jgi:hypothetical protein
MYADILKGNFQLTRCNGLGGSVADPDILRRVFHSQMVPPTGFNRGHFSDAETDRLIDEPRKPSLRRIARALREGPAAHRRACAVHQPVDETNYAMPARIRGVELTPTWISAFSKMSSDSRIAPHEKAFTLLQVPIEPFTIEPDLTADAILEKMERISFQGRSLGVAHRVWQKMLEDDVTIFMGMAGAQRRRYADDRRAPHRAPFIDCLVSTGANLYHDLTRRAGSITISARHLERHGAGEDRIDRVYDTYASEEEFCDNDVWIGDFAASSSTALHVARISEPPRRHLWSETEATASSPRRIARCADFLPGHRGLLHRHGPLAGPP